MLSKVASRSLYLAKQLRLPARAFASQIVRQDALAREVVATEDPVGFE